MFGIGMSEMLVICGVALLVFGPNELPKIAKKIARGMQELRRASDDLKRSIDIEGDDDDRPRSQPPPAITGSALNDAEPARATDALGHPIGTDDAEQSAAPRIVSAGAVAVGSDVGADPPGDTSLSPSSSSPESSRG